MLWSQFAMNIMKVAIWTIAVVGLTPAVLLAVLNLTANIAAARHLKKNPELQLGEGETGSSQCYLEFGNKYRLEVTTSYWPSVTLLVGAGAFAVGLLYLIPPQTQFREVHGFDKIEQYVEKVMNSHSPYAYIVISAADDEYTALSISSGDEGRSINFYLTKKEQIAPVLAYFSERGVEPIDDHVTEEGTDFETHHLSYPIGGTVEEVTDLCEAILTDVYGVEKDAKLLFTVGQ
jgi:hypothetical protein